MFHRAVSGAFFLVASVPKRRGGSSDIRVASVALGTDGSALGYTTTPPVSEHIKRIRQKNRNKPTSVKRRVSLSVWMLAVLDQRKFALLEDAEESVGAEDPAPDVESAAHVPEVGEDLWQEVAALAVDAAPPPHQDFARGPQ